MISQQKQKESTAIEQIQRRVLQACRLGKGEISITYPEKARQLSPAGWLSLEAVILSPHADTAG